MSVSPPDPRPVVVRGGSGVIAAEYEAITALGRQFGSVAAESLTASFQLRGYLVSESLAQSAVLDPFGHAAFEDHLESALDGRHGLKWAGTSAGQIDEELRRAAAAYQHVDRLGPGSVPSAAPAPAVLGPAGGRLVDPPNPWNPLSTLQARVTDDPGIVDVITIAIGLPILVTALAQLVPDGRGVVRNAGVDSSAVGTRTPRRLTDVMTDLASRSGDQHHGEIDVRILTMPDGTRRAIVDVTGTKSWDPLPTHDITSLTTNDRALLGRRTAYEQGVLAAMRAAGVRSRDDVMIVGHSEGGMVAVTAARDAVRSGEFNVTHVITAGAPIGISVGSVPSKVKVLAIENSRDVVPHLDGRQNPATANVTTATGSAGDSTIVGDHDITGSYLPIAGDVQASHNVSIRDFLRSARGYFQASGVQTHTYQIQRQ